MARIYLCLLIASLFLCGCVTSGQSQEQKQALTDTYEPNWESISQYQIPEWFADAKLGIFIHWGAYSVPAYGSEWYPRRMYEKGVVRNGKGEIKKRAKDEVYQHHVATYGDPSEFGYKDFIPMFKAEKFDATEWVDLFKKAGAKYVIPVAEHHDGFAMYNSSHTRWNSVDMGPKRDILAELSAATKAQGLRFGASSHFAFNWNYFTREEGWDTDDPQYADLYSRPHKQYDPCDEEFLELWWNRTTDIIDSYQPDVLWFDFYIDRPEFVPYHAKLAAYYYNKGVEWDQDVVLQTKNFHLESFPEGTNVLDIERGKLANIRKFPWQTDTSIGKNSWGYVTNWISKSPTSLLHDLIDIVSKNGCMLLNVGPKADGTIPQDQADVLLEMGEWLDVNGEAIYETRPWKIFGEGPTEVKMGHHSEGKNKAFTPEDFRFTQKEGNLYAIMLGWPETEKTVITSLAKGNEYLQSEITSVSLLGFEGELDWEITDKGLEITLPKTQPGEHAYTLKIALK